MSLHTVEEEVLGHLKQAKHLSNAKGRSWFLVYLIDMAILYCETGGELGVFAAGELDNTLHN